MQNTPPFLRDRDLPVSFSRYELLEVVGKGGMGQVFRATLNGPAGFRKEVALKMLLDRDGTVLIQRKDQLAREARLGGMLRHPNIVDTYELGEFEGEMFIAMEYIQGLPLSTLLFREKGLPPAAALDVLLQVAAAMNHAHSLRIDGEATPLVHRDLKPANILIDRTGLAKITDFGVSLLRERNQERDAAVSGTLRYMSPEQITGGLVGPQSDLFAFGIVAYEVLAGLRLFPKGEPEDIARSIIRAADLAQKSRRLQRVEESLPGIVDLIVHCLQLEVSNRVGSARHIFERLRSMRSKAPGDALLQVLARHLSSVHLLHIPGLPLPASEVSADEPSDSPSSGSSSKNNLPEDLPVLHGREDLLREVERQIKKKGKILTLKGPGGIGKSAAALHYLHQAVDRFPEGRWVFDFSDTRNEAAVLQRIAQEYRLPLRSSDTESNIEQIGRFLATKDKCILLMDNCDRVLSSLKKALCVWLRLAPNVVFLVTSRSRLKLEGERLVEVGPLDGSQSLALFMEIAGLVQTTSPIDRLTAAQIVNRLEGNPLSIALAAGRLADLESGVLLRRLRDRFSTLSTSDDTTGRQATLQATIGWSWDLLGPPEADGLTQLSVFRGSFTVDAAEAVLDLSSHSDAPPAIELLQRLIDRSLVQPLAREDRPRFLLSESIREYASGKLGPSRTALEQRFIGHFRRRGEPHYRTLLKSGGIEGREIIRDFENISHALDLALDKKSHDAMSCFLALVVILERTGPVTRALEFADKMSALDLTDHQRATIDLKRSNALIISGDLDQASGLAQNVHGTGRSLMNPELVSEALYLLAMIHIQRGQPQFVIDNAESAIAMAQQGLNNELVAWWLALRGRAHRLQGSYKESIRDFEKSGSIARQIGDQSLLANSLGSQAIIENIRGNTRVAIRLIGQSVAVARNSGDRRIHASRLFLLGTILLEAGELESALADYRRARIQYQELNETFNEAMVLVGLSQVHYLKDHFIEARALLFESLKILKEVGAEAHSGIVYINLGEIETDMGLLEEAEQHLNEGLKVSVQTGSFRVKAGIQQAMGRLYLRQRRWSEGKILLDTALEAYVASNEISEMGKTYCGLAEYHFETKEPSLGRAALEKAKELAAQTGTTTHSELGRRISALEKFL